MAGLDLCTIAGFPFTCASLNSSSFLFKQSYLEGTWSISDLAPPTLTSSHKPLMISQLLE